MILVFNTDMDYKFKPLEPKQPIECSVSFAVTKDMKLDIKRIKSDKKHNSAIFNRYVRDFLNQLIEAYDKGELDK